MDSLLPEEYQAVIGPALKAAAELAAARGDPYLYNDLPSMLALMLLVRDLADLYQDQWGALGQTSPPEVFKAAPIAACVMVFNEYDIDEESIGAMTGALETAFSTLQRDRVFGMERGAVQQAWQAMLDSNTELSDAHLRQAATSTARAIDAWEQRRAGN